MNIGEKDDSASRHHKGAGMTESENEKLEKERVEEQDYVERLLEGYVYRPKFDKINERPQNNCLL